jgi:universal stress protein E
VEGVYQELDAKVLDFTRKMADLTGAEIKVINAYSVVPLGISLDGTGIYQDEYLLDLEKQHHEKTVELATAHGIPAEKVETRNGETHLVIADCAREIDADVVVVGTVARKGLSGIFIGNTAEMTLERLDCDIITLKQDAFECPIPNPDDQ